MVPPFWAAPLSFSRGSQLRSRPNCQIVPKNQTFPPTIWQLGSSGADQATTSQGARERTRYKKQNLEAVGGSRDVVETRHQVVQAARYGSHHRASVAQARTVDEGDGRGRLKLDGAAHAAVLTSHGACLLVRDEVIGRGVGHQNRASHRVLAQLLLLQHACGE